MDSNDRFDFHQVTSRDGTQLAVRAWGAADAPPVLFLHGGGQTSWAWQKSASNLAQVGFRCLAPDFRGHGDSGWAEPDAYDIDFFADDIRAVVELCNQPPIAIGASLGGAGAMVVEGETDSDCFAALALVDITPRWETGGSERILEFLGAHPEGFDSLDSAAAAVRQYLPHRAKRANAEGLRKNLRRRADGRWQWHWDPRMLSNAREAASRWTPRLESAARCIRIPTLLVSGGLSDVVSETTINEFLKLVPHAEHVAIDDAHHMVAGDRNDRFTDAIFDFLGVSNPTVILEQP